jgi:hypothetical protein
MNRMWWNTIRLLRPFALSVIIALGGGPAFAQSGPTTPLISVDVANRLLPGLLTRTFSCRTDGRTLEFLGSVTRRDTSPVTLDVYFGAITPDGRTFSWFSGLTSIPILLEGLFPVAQGIAETSFTIAALFGRNPEHTCSSGQVTGRYSIFLLLVFNGADPGNPDNWFGASMSPLVILEPLTP